MAKLKSTVPLRFKKLHPDAVLPSYAKEGDAGLDITATRVVSEPGKATYGTGLAVEIPEGYVGLIFPRSSIRKYSLSLSNAVGVVDSGYRGEIEFTFRKTSDEYKIYMPGERIGQLVVLPYPHVSPLWADELSETERGDGGFGSSGA